MIRGMLSIGSRGIAVPRRTFRLGIRRQGGWIASVLLAWLAGWLSALGAPIPEPGWIFRATIAGMVPTHRPEVILRASSSSETVLIRLTVSEEGGVPWAFGEVPFESRFAGEVPTPGRLPLQRAAVDIAWSLRVDGVDLSPGSAGGVVSFGPSDRGRTDSVRVDFSGRAPADTFATWSLRIFGVPVDLDADPDGDGLSNQMEFLRGGNPLTPTSPAANRAPVAMLDNDWFLAFPGREIAVTNRVSDPDQPPQSLAWRLVSGPTGAAIHPASGVWTWLPRVSDAFSTNQVAVAVDDDGTPQLSATNRFTVIVSGGGTEVTADLLKLRIKSVSVDGTLALEIRVPAGVVVDLERSDLVRPWLRIARLEGMGLGQPILLPMATEPSTRAEFLRLRSIE